ncbi:MAG: DUF6095 family protein, partial [Flavobacteriaceae bacterium]
LTLTIVTRKRFVPLFEELAFKNQEHMLYVPVLGVAILMCLAAIFLGFRGIKLMVKGLFNEE